MKSDIDTYGKLISVAINRNADRIIAGAPPWRAVASILPPANIENANLEDISSIILFHDKILIETILEIYINHKSIVKYINDYNELRSQFDKHTIEDAYVQDGEIFIKPSDDPRRHAIESSLQNYITFLIVNIPLLSAKCELGQHKIFEVSKRHFRNNDFLRAS